MRTGKQDRYARDSTVPSIGVTSRSREINDGIIARKSCHLTIDEPAKKTVARKFALRSVSNQRLYLSKRCTFKIKSFTDREKRKIEIF